MRRAFSSVSVLSAVLLLPPSVECAPVSFQRDIQPILSQNCFLCHGPDEKDRKSGFRLDLREEALKGGKSGKKAIIPKRASESELVARITTSDADDKMPPPKSGKKLTEKQIDLLRRWVDEGAPYAMHWSYVKPRHDPLPKIQHQQWVRNGIDYFIAQRLEKEGLEPAPEADKRTLIRRVALDLTGIPPSPEEVAAFLADTGADAYERLVDRMLDKESFGEHWARMWLDLARYADSAGYADDPLRTIWAYRDYVINSFNRNKPFDQFTIEQLAGDLLEDPSDEQLVATAFHRNTMTNNEGGTSDEEFRSAAVVDRVNTTFAVWMGTSIACAQCHTHKYDPITQEEYFKVYAIFNNTEDADRSDESPTLKLFTRPQKKERAALESELSGLETKLATATPELLDGFEAWEKEFPRHLEWNTLKPLKGDYKREVPIEAKDNVTRFDTGAAREIYNIEFSVEPKPVSALRMELMPDQSGSPAAKRVINRISAVITPPKSTVGGRFVRIELKGKNKTLSLAEVQVFSGKDNIATSGSATQSSTRGDSEAKRAIDGKTDGNAKEQSLSETEKSENPWWELDLQAFQEIGRIAIWNRTDGDSKKQLAGIHLAILNDQRETVWERDIKDAPNPSLSLEVTSARTLEFAGAFATGTDKKHDPKDVLAAKADSKKGWSPETTGTNSITLLAEKPFTPESGSRLVITIEDSSESEHQPAFRFDVSGDTNAARFAHTPSAPLAILAREKSGRTEAETGELTRYYLRNVAPELKHERTRAADLKRDLDEMKPYTVPIMHELAGDKRRKTHLQYRGNYMDLGQEVKEGVPAAFHPLPSDLPPNRLALAKWIVDPENPLTARVTVNRFWEQIFGIGLVRTTEEFGAQGEQPSHPELLDWLATEFTADHWNVKRFLKLLVTSAAYRQSSRVTPELAERDPDNRLLARGPRFRIPAEEVRDQALFVAGLLSPKLGGPSVKPPQPSSGLSAAFGSSVDWKTSDGEDRYRRGLYTEWRRTSPYPSMATFDAPNREVCTLRRNRTNTPLQALVTLNDPVYVEAAQGLARRMMRSGASVADRIRRGFEFCLSREPNQKELNRVAELFGEAIADYAKSPSEKAEKMAGITENAADGGTVEFAAWTAVANVILNLDETLMKR